MRLINNLFIQAYDSGLKRLLRGVFASKVELSRKQDVINDLATIRSCAAAGATAVQPSVMNTALTNTVAESGVYDVSDNNSGATFASLGALLSAQNLDTLIPVAKRKGGMSIKFVLTSDNKYVRFNLLTDEFSTDVEDWEQSASVAQLEELEDKAVMTGSYDATVAVGLADNLRGDTVVNAEFYKRKTGGTQSVGSGIAAIKEVRGKSLVWNQIIGNNDFTNSENVAVWGSSKFAISFNDNSMELSYDDNVSLGSVSRASSNPVVGHKYLALYMIKALTPTICGAGYGGDYKTLIWQVGTSWNVYGYILTAKSTDRFVYAYAQLGSGNKVNIRYVNMFDLTLMFGAGNEPSIAEFEKTFPLDYYDYNAGEIIPFAGQNLTTTGKNQYNPATCKANLLGGQQYQIGGTFTGATIDGVAVTLDSNNCFTTTKDCVLDITGGNDTNTFVGLYNGETNTYEPYEKHTLPLDPSQWRDKQGNLVFPYGGMHGVGDAYDYAKVDADGYIRKVVRCFGQVDLGSLIWNKTSGATDEDTYFQSTNESSIKRRASKPNMLCRKYLTLSWSKIYRRVSSNYNENGVSQYNGTNTVYIVIADTSYTDATAFKTAMNGVPLIYELAEPVEVELSTPVYAKYLVDKDGTEEITPANGTTPYTTMANLSILYAMDARGEIKNLPKNYLSKESAENMLNAMVSAGVIQSYTMTWDAANNRYAFVITAPVEPEETNN